MALIIKLTGTDQIPQTFSEKVRWRMNNDRRDVLVDYTDKLKCYQRAEQLNIPLPSLFTVQFEVIFVQLVPLFSL